MKQVPEGPSGRDLCVLRLRGKQGHPRRTVQELGSVKSLKCLVVFIIIHRKNHHEEIRIKVVKESETRETRNVKSRPEDR